jgi:protease-4
VRRSSSLLIAAALLAAGCQGRAPRADDTASSDGKDAHGASPAKSRALDAPAVVEIDLSRGLPEGRSSSILGTSTRRSHVDLVRTLRALAGDDDAGAGSAPSSVKGVLVRFGGARIGFARAEEIGGLLGAIRKTRPVVCHADEYGNGSMMLAALGCSKIWVSPAGGVETVGIAAQLLFANRLLERLHVGVDFLQIGKYKGAQEPYTRNEPSPEARESLEGTLRGMRAAWIAHLAEGRGKLSAADAVEDGPWSPADAVAHGLVDAVGYQDEAVDDAKKLAGADHVVARFSGGGAGSRGIVGVLRSLAGSSRGGSPHVAVVAANGAITMSASTSILGSSDGITEHELGRVVSRLTTDSAVKAVVLRIDSPGGSALASDLLWRKLRKLGEKKPLVVSVGDMAASGGYYLSCAGTKILAEPTSIVGSIGVVGGKLALGKTLEEIGVHAETVAAAPDPAKAARATYNSAFAAWDDGTRERVRASMKAIYDLFLRRVAEGRGIDVEAASKFAEGRIFAGVEAKERGLVDAIGGVGDAIDLARQLASLPKDAPVEVVDEESGLLGLLEESERGGDDDDSSAPAQPDAMAATAQTAAQRAAHAIAFPPGWADALPGAEAFLGSVSPLVSGELMLAAMPFGLVVR